MSQHTGETYQAIATNYAETIDSKPLTVFYERPAFLSLLPNVQNKYILDAGCGTGWHSDYLLSQGATVTAFDLNPIFVKKAQSLIQHRGEVLQANLAEPLTFAQDEVFDLVICSLVMHYIQDWQSVFQEFHRVLKPGGQLVFSTHHPFTDWQEFETNNYFAMALLEDTWDVGKVTFYRRPRTMMSQDLAATGFMIEQILEPQPLDPLREIDPEVYQRFMAQPWRLMMRARKTIPSTP